MDASSYTSQFVNGQIVDTYVNLLLMTMSGCVPFPKLENEPCDFDGIQFWQLKCQRKSLFNKLP